MSLETDSEKQITNMFSNLMHNYRDFAHASLSNDAEKVVLGDYLNQLSTCFEKILFLAKMLVQNQALNESVTAAQQSASVVLSAMNHIGFAMVS